MLFLRYVRNGGEDRVIVRMQRLARRAGSAPAASHQPDLDRLSHGRAFEHSRRARKKGAGGAGYRRNHGVRFRWAGSWDHFISSIHLFCLIAIGYDDAVNRRHFLLAGSAALAAPALAKTRDIRKAIMYETIQLPGSVLGQIQGRERGGLRRHRADEPHAAERSSGRVRRHRTETRQRLLRHALETAAVRSRPGRAQGRARRPDAGAARRESLWRDVRCCWFRRW